MTNDGAELAGAPQPREANRRVVDDLVPFGEECLGDTVTSPGLYLAVVQDVAARYTKLPYEHVVRALRRELSGFGDNEETIHALARRIASGHPIAG
jgi:hypothetical protein